MQPEEKESVNEFAQMFWANPENVKQFQKVESEIREDVDVRLSSGNVHLRNRWVTTEEDSVERCARVGWPTYELQ